MNRLIVVHKRNLKKYRYYLYLNYLFQESKLKLKDAAMIFYCFAMDFPINDCKKHLPDIAHSTIVKFYEKLRGRLEKIMEEITFEGSVDGNSEIVEIDESIFGKKRKDSRGRQTKRIWVFGIAERSTKKTCFIPVENRTKETLLPIIQSKVSVDAMIFHDDWPVYRNLEDIGYRHDTVIHKKEFVSKSGVCTNSIEG